MKIQVFSLLMLAASTAWSQPQVIVTGLQGPQKLILTPRGNFLVSETSMQANSARISFVSRAGVRRSLMENLPSGTEVTGTGGSGPSALALRERTLYVAMGAGDAERPGTQPGTAMYNPAGASSSLFACILEMRFSQDVDTINGTFRMTPEVQQRVADGGEASLDDGSGATARITFLTRFPASEPDRNAIYKFANPWGLALTEDGQTLYMNDASQNTLVRVSTATGRWQRIARFAPLPNADAIGPPVVDAVPTSVRLYDGQLLVSFLTGFPFAPGYARVLAVNPENGASEPFIFGVSSAVDVLWRRKADGSRQFFVLEFSQNQSAAPAPPGRLLRFNNPQPEVMAADLRAPVSLAYDAATGDLFVLELSGRLLQFRAD